MHRILTFFVLLIAHTCLFAAGNNYQIDLIVFAYQHPSNAQDESNLPPLHPPRHQTTRMLQPIDGSLIPWHLLPASQSHLKKAYYTLNHKLPYRVLLHSSWIQPANNQFAVSIPRAEREGWGVEGTIRVRQSNYYLLDTQLVFSTPTPHSFIFSQSQRLKPGVIYYLDHPQAGLLVTISRVS